MKVGDLITHKRHTAGKWKKDYGIVVGRPPKHRMPPPNNWYVVFGTKKIMVHEDSCEVLSESR